MITDILSSLATIAQQIYAQVKLAEANQAQCQVLKQRIDVIVKAIKDLEKLPNADRFKPALISLHSCLQDALKFISEFSRNKAWYQKLLNAGSSEAQFKKLNEQLQKCIEPLNLGLAAQQLFNQAEDKKAQSADMAFIKANEDRILKLNQEAVKAVQQLKVSQEQQHAILLKQMASMRACLQGQHPKTEIEAHLLVPYHELRFDEAIGSGSFGIVYKGVWDEQRVAIKTIEGELSKEDREQFVREVQILSRLRSPHIVQLYGVCLENDRLCMVMELLKSPLSQVVSTLNPLQHKEIALDIARGLSYLHKRGMVHCDLKSDNILVNEQGQAKIADFGLSKAATFSIKAITEKSQALEWQAPECLQMQARFSPESDIYAFGMILFELMTGKKPFANVKREFLLQHILSGKQETLPESSLKPLIESCWQKDPHKRPSLRTIIETLEKYQPVDPEALYQQGVALERDKKFQEAFSYYAKATRLGHVKANASMGFCYLTAQGVAKDYGKALEHLSFAAERGHVRGMCNLATIYRDGIGVAKSADKALHWYQRAAAQGDEKARTESLKLENVRGAAGAGAGAVVHQYKPAAKGAEPEQALALKHK